MAAEPTIPSCVEGLGAWRATAPPETSHRLSGAKLERLTKACKEGLLLPLALPLQEVAGLEGPLPAADTRPGGARSVDWVLPVLKTEREEGAGLHCVLSMPRQSLPPALVQRLVGLAQGAAEDTGAGAGASSDGPDQQQQESLNGGAAAGHAPAVGGEEKERQQGAGEKGDGCVGVTVSLGNRRLMMQRGVEIDPEVRLPDFCGCHGYPGLL
jgi:hypothetical protein